MDRLFFPLIPAAIIGAVANGTGFPLSDAVFIGIAAWAAFVVFRSLLGVTSTIVIVCALGALSQISPHGPTPSYAITAAEASPGTITHLVRSVYRAVEGEVGISPATTAGTQPAETQPTGNSPRIADSLATPPEEPIAGAPRMVKPLALGVPGPVFRGPVVVASASPLAPFAMRTMLRTPSSTLPIAVAGQPRVIDGTTLSIDGHLIRLAGISAPDGASDCWRNGQPASCPAMATERLSQLLGTARVTCHGPAQGSVIVAQCSTTMMEDVAKALLDEGWAVLGRDSSPSYRAVAAVARGSRRGLWQSNFSRADELELPVTAVRR